MDKSKTVIFFVGLIGDSIVALPAIEAIRQRVGRGGWLGLLNEQKSGLGFSGADVFRDLGLFNRILQFPAGVSRARRGVAFLSLAWQFRRIGISDVICLAPSARPVAALRRDKLFFKLCGAKRCWGFAPIPRGDAVVHEGESHLIRLSLAGYLRDYTWPPTSRFLSPPPNAQARAAAWLRARGGGRGPKIGIAPGTNQPSKLWPLERFAALGQRLIAQFNAEIVILGGRAERQCGLSLIEKWRSGCCAAGEFSVLETAALLQQLDTYIGLDTGVSHMAAGVGTPGVVLFSQKNLPGSWEPLSSGITVVRSEPVRCRGCESSACFVPGHPCMSNISVDTVFEAVSRVLAAVTPPREM